MFSIGLSQNATVMIAAASPVFKFAKTSMSSIAIGFRKTNLFTMLIKIHPKWNNLVHLVYRDPMDCPAAYFPEFRVTWEFSVT